MENINCVCPCLLGLEGLVSNELKDMGIKNVQAENGRVLFSDNIQSIARVNICSRYIERVMVLMGRFEAHSFDELFENVKKLPWEKWIGKKDAFPVKGRALSSKLSSIPDCQSIIKKAIVERLKLKYKIPWFEETENLYRVQFLIMKNKVSVMIDTSGEGLHKRGYRRNSTIAPIKETLAAAMANLAHVKGFSNVFDPFCGSGTILIESALLAMNMAPGLRRNFISEKWNNINSGIWKVERSRAQDLIRKDVEFNAYGFDIDSNALFIANENAKKAGVSSKIKLKLQDIRKFNIEQEKGIVICNPPYGERLLDIDKAKELYRIMGKKFKRKKGWSYYVISPYNKFEDCYGTVADKRRKLYNGMIKCQYYMYFK